MYRVIHVHPSKTLSAGGGEGVRQHLPLLDCTTDLTRVICWAEVRTRWLHREMVSQTTGTGLLGAIHWHRYGILCNIESMEHICKELIYHSGQSVWLVNGQESVFLLFSTGWFQEWIWAWFYNFQTKTRQRLLLFPWAKNVILIA